MAYDSMWEKLSDTLTRVMEANGSTRNDAQVDICRAIADRAIKIRAKPLRSKYGSTASPDTVLEGKHIRFSMSLKPEDFDWPESRPLKQLLVPRGEAPVRHGHWDIAWIELYRSDVTNVLCAAQKGDKHCGSLPDGVIIPSARNKRAPAREAATG